jgi:hypothetical protein
MVQSAAPSLAREARAWSEFVQLIADPVYYGAGLPRGDGRLVLVLPGLFGNDWYLRPLRVWLNRIGYRSVPSTLVVNAGCPERLTREVEAHLQRRMQPAPGPVVLIGHSRGAGGGWQSPAHSGVTTAGNRARRLLDPECEAPFCNCPFPRDLVSPLSPNTSVVSIYSREDPIVPPWSCEMPGAVNIQVAGSHIGLAANRDVYRELAAALHQG